MKNNLLAKLGLLFVSFAFVACETIQREKVCDVAEDFAETYFMLNIRKAKQYCIKELHVTMEFRHNSLTKRDWEFLKKAGDVSVKVVDCELNLYNDEAYVDMEVSNFLRINYLNDSLNIIPCDTIELVLVRGRDKKWLIKKLM